MVDDRIDPALEHLPGGGGPTLLRSWMLTELEHEALSEALAERAYWLIADTAADAAAHYLPAYHDAIAEWAAPTGSISTRRGRPPASSGRRPT